MVGRTHGIHAEPISFGLKFLRYHQEFTRGLQRLQRAREVVRYGQISGAVGSYGTLDPRVEPLVCEKLGLAGSAGAAAHGGAGGGRAIR